MKKTEGDCLVLPYVRERAKEQSVATRLETKEDSPNIDILDM